MRRLFFYDFPYPTTHFTQSILPNLRRSLSLTLTLQHFFPLAENLVTPTPPHSPFLRFSASPMESTLSHLSSLSQQMITIT
ncbi:Anthocyanin 5-aromatic acyltransferase [Linum perenne]